MNKHQPAEPMICLACIFMIQSSSMPMCRVKRINVSRYGWCTNWASRSKALAKVKEGTDDGRG